MYHPVLYCTVLYYTVLYCTVLYCTFCIVKVCNRVFAKAEFTNLNFTKKVRILFVESEVEADLRKRNRFSTKYLTGRKKMWVGIICGVVPQNSKILWNSRPLFCGITQYFLVRCIFCGVGFVNSAFANTLISLFETGYHVDRVFLFVSNLGR